MPDKNSRSILILYHFYPPDDVISARHFADLAEGLAKRGWDVTVYTSNRYCRNANETISPRHDTINNVRVVRHSRAGLNQSRNISRLLNSATISCKWLISILFSRHYDVVLFGTDPQFGYYIAPVVKLFKRKSKTAIWAFDLYPEIIGQMNGGKFSRMAVSILKPWTGISYRSMDFIADLGSCMRERIAKYKSNGRQATLIPWAISEPGERFEPEKEIRHKLFGDRKLAILYSGTIGKAHKFEEFIELARELRRRGSDVGFCFAGRGNSYQQLRDMVSSEDTNISFAGFADEKELELRLSAADMHMISLREGWEGLVVPSKFFGSLAAGRPLLYAGASDSAIKEWLERFDIGYYLDSSRISELADKLDDLSKNPEQLNELQARTFTAWQENFTREYIIEQFDRELSKLLTER